jgi:gliding motility-associated-like protein
MYRRVFLFALTLGMIIQTRSQICTGSLGDPIVNITFGAGSNPGPALPSSSVVGYQYVNYDCPQDGQYTIRNASITCHNNTWHSITDHTGNPNGYFMLVNASMHPNPFYIDTVRGLCGNTTYEFSSWVINMLKPGACGTSGIEPDLTFRIEKTDGTILQSYNTNKIAATSNPQWRQVGFYFTTAASTSDVVIRIINNSAGGCGNDLALDDITFRPCGPQITSSIVGVMGTATSFCEGLSRSYTFTANISNGFNNPVVQWQESINSGTWTDITGATSVTYTKNFASSATAATYQYRLAAAESGNMGTMQCRINSPVLQVLVASNPAPAASANSPICEGKTINLAANGSVVNWTGPNGFVATGTRQDIYNAQSIHSGKYYVLSVNGSCSNADSVMVNVNPNPSINADRTLVNICEGDSVQVNVTGADTYTWQPTDKVVSSGASAWLKPVDSMLYIITGTTSGCSDTASVMVNVADKPEANAGADRTIMEGAAVQLQGIVKGDSIQFYWTPDYQIASLQSIAPWVSPLRDTSYRLNVQSLLGCGIVQDDVRIRVLKKLGIANAFSPNGDGINDNWIIEGIDTYDNAEVLVFDRFGRQVFKTSRFSGWNGTLGGKKLPMGTYYYIIDVKQNLPILTGWLQLLY